MEHYAITSSSFSSVSQCLVNDAVVRRNANHLFMLNPICHSLPSVLGAVLVLAATLRTYMVDNRRAPGFNRFSSYSYFPLTQLAVLDIVEDSGSPSSFDHRLSLRPHLGVIFRAPLL